MNSKKSKLLVYNISDHARKLRAMLHEHRFGTWIQHNIPFLCITSYLENAKWAKYIIKFI